LVTNNNTLKACVLSLRKVYLVLKIINGNVVEML